MNLNLIGKIKIVFLLLFRITHDKKTLINIYCYNAFLGMPRNAFRLHTNRHGNPYSFTIGNSMRALSIDVKAHAGYHLIFCASKYLHGKCICRHIFTSPLNEAFTHTHTNEIMTQIRTFLCHSVVVVVYHKLYRKESLSTIYRYRYL